jgi:valyl-tRNA synthetase
VSAFRRWATRRSCKKFSNEKFVSNAKPDVIEKELKKASDAQEKIRLLEEQLGVLQS